MKHFGSLALGLIMGATLTVGSSAPVAAQGRTLDDTSRPAELPAATFRGRQYVDSRGCVFIRAGSAGQTVWVPRVNRDRTVLCGQAPTGQGQGRATVAAAPARTAPPAPAAPTIARAPTPAPSTPPAADAPTRAAAAQVRPAAGPSVPVAAAPVRTGVTAATVPRSTVVTLDPTRPSPWLLRRQAAVASLRARSSIEVPDSTGRPDRVAPARTTFGVPVPPPGYRTAWRDGRLNPLRGPRTVEGDRQSDFILTRETPRGTRFVLRRR